MLEAAIASSVAAKICGSVDYEGILLDLVLGVCVPGSWFVLQVFVLDEALFPWICKVLVCFVDLAVVKKNRSISSEVSDLVSGNVVNGVTIAKTTK